MTKTRSFIFIALGVLISVTAPLIATVTYFPVWRIRGGAETLSGVALVFILICAMPLARLIKRALSSASIPLLWLYIFIVFYALESIAHEVTVVALVGFISNTVGAILYKIGRKGVKE